MLWTFLVAQCKGSARQCRRPRFDPWVEKISWRREWQTHTSILACRIPWTEDPGWLHTDHGVAKSQAWLNNNNNS